MILVILFHLGYGWMPGGFVGVDVFFVLSGYLITGLLVDESARDGSIDLARFYARRVRRLLPAAVLVIAVVIVVTLGLLDRVDQAAVGPDATFSALYSANWRFGLVEGDYFAPGDVPSPLIHFWSLAVEEQFYVGGPRCCSACGSRGGARVAGRGSCSVRSSSSGSSPSLLSVLLPAGPLTYYGTHTLAYQLLAGAALAIAARRWMTRAIGAPDGGAALRASGAVLSVAAFGALALLAHEIPDAQEYPACGPSASRGRASSSSPRWISGSHPLRRLAGARLPAAVGRLSYSLYLWHWPTIVFLPLVAARVDAPLLGERPVLVAAMTILAPVSYRLWEQPIRFRAWPALPSRRVVVAGLATSAALGLATLVVLQPPRGFEGRALAAVRTSPSRVTARTSGATGRRRPTAVRACCAAVAGRPSRSSATRTPSSGSRPSSGSPSATT